MKTHDGDTHTDPSLSATRTVLLHTALTMTARSAAAFVLAVVILLAVNHRQARQAAPLSAPELATLRTELRAQPDSAALKEHIRALDLLARRAYFSSLDFGNGGAWMLLCGVVVLLASARGATALNPRRPDPRGGLGAMPALPATKHEHLRTQQLVSTVAGTALALLLALGLHTQRFRYPDAADLPRASTPAAAAAATPGLAPVASPAPTRDSVLRNWPNFRGPDGNATAFTTNAPTRWDGAGGTSILWKARVPLHGNSSPIVWEDRIFLTGADSTNREIYAFDAATGQLLWTHRADERPADTLPKVSADTGLASPTAATDGQRVFAIFGTGDLVAIDFTGRRLWAKALGVPDISYGHASSLIVWRNHLLVQLDHRDQARLLALDTASGAEVWSAARNAPAWGSPICVNTGSRDEAILTCNKGVDAYSPMTGAKLWSSACMDSEVGTSAAYANGLVFVGNAYTGGSALRLHGTNDPPVTVVWEYSNDLPEIASPLATDARIYLASSGGGLTCLDAASGAVQWQTQFDAGFSASPILAAGNVYALDQDGVMHVVADATNLVVIGRCALGEPSVCTPAFAGDRLYLRGAENLYAVGGAP